jgi:hypothetical protein
MMIVFLSIYLGCQSTALAHHGRVRYASTAMNITESRTKGQSHECILRGMMHYRSRGLVATQLPTPTTNITRGEKKSIRQTASTPPEHATK